MTVYHALFYQYSEFGWVNSVALVDSSSSFTPDKHPWRGP
jgi:hypothetical protein